MSTDASSTPHERAEEELSWVGLAAAETLRAAELAVIAVLALLICPPLAILAIIVFVPLIVVAAIVALVASVIALPLFIVRHAHRHRAGDAHHRIQRLAAAGRAASGSATSRLGRLVTRTK